ncbi:MAG: ATP-binding cassette domain-containing protein [Actinomycetota bacterium]
MLTARDLRAGYGTVPVLHGISMAVAVGEIVAVVGRNGVGKTTLVKTLMGVIPATSGRVMLGSDDLTGRTPSHRVRAGVRATYQEGGVFAELTVEENLRLNGFRRPDHEEVLAAFPATLAGRSAQRAGTLSGGEQKMLAAAVALSSSAPILVMDEPTEGLQPSNVDVLGTLLDAARIEGRGILLVEQHLALATRLADRFVVIEKGTVVDEGRADEPDIHRRVADRLVL